MSDSSCKNIAIDFLQQVAMGGIRAAYQNYVADNFRHHNPYFRGDAESLMAGMLENAAANPQKLLEVRLALQEDEPVWRRTQTRMPTRARADVEAVEPGRARERIDPVAGQLTSTFCGVVARVEQHVPERVAHLTRSTQGAGVIAGGKQ